MNNLAKAFTISTFAAAAVFAAPLVPASMAGMEMGVAHADGTKVKGTESGKKGLDSGSKKGLDSGSKKGLDTGKKGTDSGTAGGL